MPTKPLDKYMSGKYSVAENKREPMVNSTEPTIMTFIPPNLSTKTPQSKVPRA